MDVANEYLWSDDPGNGVTGPPNGTLGNNPGGVIFLIKGNQSTAGDITASVYSGEGNVFNYVPYSLPCPGDCQDETGYAGNEPGIGGRAWWYAYDTQGPVQQNIYAGQNLIIGGWVEYSAGTPGTFTIHLADWELMYTNEPVKVTEFNAIPDRRPKPGKAQYKTYEYNSDGDIVVYVDPNYRYYAIHLDLQLCP